MQACEYFRWDSLKYLFSIFDEYVYDVEQVIRIAGEAVFLYESRQQFRSVLFLRERFEVVCDVQFSYDGHGLKVSWIWIFFPFQPEW